MYASSIDRTSAKVSLGMQKNDTAKFWLAFIIFITVFTAGIIKADMAIQDWHTKLEHDKARLEAISQRLHYIESIQTKRFQTQYELSENHKSLVKLFDETFADID